MKKKNVYRDFDFSKKENCSMLIKLFDDIRKFDNDGWEVFE